MAILPRWREYALGEILAQLILLSNNVDFNLTSEPQKRKKFTLDIQKECGSTDQIQLGWVWQWRDMPYCSPLKGMA